MSKDDMWDEQPAPPKKPESSLDDKLVEILQAYLKDWVENDGRPKHLIQDIEDILPDLKQAFIDKGWVKIPQIREIKGKVESQHTPKGDNPFMTGQAGYDRFEIELMTSVGKRFTDPEMLLLSKVLKAARKSAGLE